MKKSIEYIQSLRFLSFFVVLSTHFVSFVQPALFAYWIPDNHFIGYILIALRGKCGVAIFCLISGYLAYHVASKKKNIDIGADIVKRYFRFMLNALFINILFFLTLHLFNYLDIATTYVNTSSLKECIIDGVFLKGVINPPLWVIKDLFIGYLLCEILYVYLSNKSYRYIAVVLIEFTLYIGDKPWLFCIVLGLFLAMLDEEASKIGGLIRLIFKHKICIIIELIIAYICFKQAESLQTFYIYSIGAFAFINAIKESQHLKRLIANSFFVKCGDISFEAYMLHVFLLYFTIPIIQLIFGLENVVLIFIMYMVCVIICTLGYKQHISSNIEKLIKYIMIK